MSTSFARIRQTFELGGVGRDEQETEDVGSHDRELRQESRILRPAVREIESRYLTF